MSHEIYLVLWIFIIYAFIGWCSEVVYAASCTGKFVNRGFLNGPACPVYGFGVLFVILCLTPVKDNLLLLFVGSVLLTSTLEFLTGFILEKFFEDKWWDYSNEPFNIKGYICLKFSLLWGVACVLVMDTIHPAISHFINLIPMTAGIIILSFFLLVLLADIITTLAATINLKKRLSLMDELGCRLKELSARLGEPLAEGTVDMKEKLAESTLEVKEITNEARERLAESTAEVRERFTAGTQEIREKLAEGRLELEELKARIKTLSDYPGFIQKRLLDSFPRLQTGRYRETFERIRQYHNNRHI
ncbi:MAG: hypothetical protein HGA22_09460 [Clostridiales bacterium]|nr:hypothetical protein [Clostridiales bacterium]